MNVDETFLDSIQLKTLREKRMIIETKSNQRNVDLQKNNQIILNKLEREIEFLIQDKSLIDKRNNHIFQNVYGLRSKILQQYFIQQYVDSISRAQTSNENLSKSKQNIYDHLLKHNPKLAREFYDISNVRQSDPIKQMDYFEAKGAQIREKENNLTLLHQRNQKLQDELQHQKQQQIFIQQYKTSPFIDPEVLIAGSNQQPIKTRSKNLSSEEPNSNYSMEQRVMDQYIGSSQNDSNFQNESGYIKNQVPINRQYQQKEQLNFATSKDEEYVDDFEMIDDMQ